LRAVLQDQRGPIMRFLTARSGSADLAQDLFQDLWLRLGQVEHGPIANPVAYLMRAANNLMLDYRRGELRARTRDTTWLDADSPAMLAPDLRADPAPAADEAIAARQEAALLRRAIEGLPPGARRALILHRIDGLAHADVAVVMGISRSGVEKHLAVAMKHLRRSIVNWGGPPRAASESLTRNSVSGSRCQPTPPVQPPTGYHQWAIGPGEWAGTDFETRSLANFESDSDKHGDLHEPGHD
jgi:RNA polymerase sigma-70 factor (ECF subfamily)